MEPISFSVVLTTALTPITLISGVGLLLLSMSARYMHTSDRVRQLLKTREMMGYQNPALDAQLRLLFRRAQLLKKAVESVVLSATFSGILVFASVIEAMFDLELGDLKSALLVIAVGCIILTTVYFVAEVHLSLKAIEKSVISKLGPE